MRGAAGELKLTPRVNRRVAGTLGVFVLLSIPPLAEIVGWWVLAVVGAAAALVLLGRFSVFFRSLAEVLGAIVVPWLCLIGFNWVLHLLFGEHLHPSLTVGLILAVVVFALAAAAYLRLSQERKWATVPVALVLAVVNVIGVPLLVAAEHEDSKVEASRQVVSQLDLTIVVPARGGESLRPVDSSRAQPDWDVRYSVARAGAKSINWLLLDSPDSKAASVAARGTGPRVPRRPAPREGADQLVLLDVDGARLGRDPGALPSLRGSKGEVARWLDIADRAAPGAPVAVLLQTTDQKRIDSWKAKVEPLGGSVAPVQTLGARTLTDAALQLAAETPEASEELSLALKYRPVLLFDSAEGARTNTPLNIDAFLASGRVDLCRDDQLRGSTCERVLKASSLVSGSTHLRIHKRRARDPVPASTIYVHPSAVEQDGRRLLYLDYWWYLDGNPADIGKGTSCGVGLALPGLTCFDHDSDWEGMTVVLDRTGPEAKPVAAQYAQHGATVRYSYAALQRYWAKAQQRNKRWRSRRFRQNLARIDDADRRPLAFIARGTHASYREVCVPGCKQTAEKDRPENPHNGLLSWPANDTAHCIATGCLRLLPTRRGGRDPALWNSYDGVWGERKCIMHGTFCDAEKSPAAPATQGRYQAPEKVTGYVDARWRFHSCGSEAKPCPALPAPQD